MGRRALLAALVAAGLVLLPPSTAGAARGLEIGFHDQLFTSGSPAERSAWLGRADGLGARYVRIWVYWPRVASTEPTNPRNPLDPAYDFTAIDAGVRDAVSRGLEPMFTTYFAPDWAEGPNRPRSAPAGTWKPDPKALGDFMFALARRYSGGLAGLPRVRYFQDWNEANLSTYLTPQWDGKRPVGAEHYRRMNVASFEAVNAVDRSNVLIGSGLAPYGEPAGGERTRPLRFWRDVFCLRDRRKLKPKKCVQKQDRAHIEIMAHHPINTSGGPSRSALHPDDASSADVSKVTRVLRRAEQTGRVLPGGKRELWATEFWWESDPPDRKQGVSLKKHARYIAESLYLFWKGGASVAIALQIRDAKVTRETIFDRSATGAYFLDGGPKPAVTAYRFPFVAAQKGGRAVELWGKAPQPGQVVVERRTGKGWKKVAHLQAGKNRIFSGRTRLDGKAKLRARNGGETSLVWRLD